MTPLILAGLLLTLAWWLIFRRFPLDPALIRRSLGQLLELLLYGDSPRVLGKVWLDLGATSLRIGRALLAPSLVSLLILLGVLDALDRICRFRPIEVGERFIVSAPAREAMGLEHADGLRLEGPGLFDAAAATCYWRLVALQPGSQWLRLSSGSHPSQVQVATGWMQLRRSDSGLRVYYPRREFWLGDRCLDWSWLLGMSCLAWLAAGLVFKCCWCILVRQEGLGSSRKR